MSQLKQTTLQAGPPPPGARQVREELMDDDSLGDSELFRALRGLSRINRLSGSARLLWPFLAAQAARLDRPIRVLDIATGSGDIPIALKKRALATGIEIEIHACDRNLKALHFAKAKSKAAGGRIWFFPLDALNEPLPLGYDIITCSLFLHHLNNTQAAILLKKLSEAAGSGFIINDLRRERFALALAFAATRLVSRSQVLRTDGVRSIQNAFTVQELTQLANQAGLRSFTVEKRFPARMLLFATSHDCVLD